MIVSLHDVVQNEDQYAIKDLSQPAQAFQEKELTIRCEVTGIPSTGMTGGEKTLYPVDDPTARLSEDVLLSFWHEDSEWGRLEETDKAIQNLVDMVPLQRGEELLVRAIPVYREDKWYLNVTSLFVRNPDMTIGKSEMRSANECPRIYDLRYEKNVYNPKRYDISKGAIKGKIAHRALERAIEDPEFATNFQSGWTDGDIETLLGTVIEESFSMEMTLCRLAWVSTNDIKEFAEAAIRNLLTDRTFTQLIQGTENLETERTIADAYGLNGRVDLLIDGRALDLKTNYFLEDGMQRQHRFQLRLYMFGLLLEALDQGTSIDEALDELPPGMVIYPSLETESAPVYERVELEHDHLIDIMELRNQAATLRDSFAVPTTYDRNCSGCYFKDEDTIGSGAGTGQTLPSACKFHCQSERRWACHETNAEGEVTTECPLYHECDQRLEYRNPSVTDHYNELRSALQEEKRARKDAGQTMARMTDEVLEHAGMQLSKLSFESELSARRLTYSGDSSRQFEPGTVVRLVPANEDSHAVATYCGTQDGHHIFEFDGSPAPRYKQSATTYQAERALESTSLPRRLLSELDYAQRIGLDPRLRESGEISTQSQRIAPHAISEITDYLDNRQVFIDLPARVSRSAKLTQLVQTITQTRLSSLDGDPINESDQRVLVLGARLSEFQTMADHLIEGNDVIHVDGFVDRDNAYGPDSNSHQLYQAIDESNVLLSRAQYALQEGVFHSMTEGDESHRSHSDRFFDAVVLLGAETLTEPEFVFLRELGDRTVAVGDINREGPEMVSEDAREKGLAESYFVNAHKRFSTMSSDSATSISIQGEAASPVADFFEPLDTDLNGVGGSASFHHVPGEEKRAEKYMTIERRIHSAGETDQPRDIFLEAVDRGDALYVASQLDDLNAIDASEFRVGQTYTFGEARFQVENNDVAPNRETGHVVTVDINLAETPYFTRRLVSNPQEAEAAAELAANQDCSIIVTPFEAQAVAIGTELSERGLDIPVVTPDALDGDIAENAIVSLTVANDENIVRPPVNNIETLYTLLSAAEHVTILGDEETLARNTLTEQLIDL
ncbi:hypothetical protein NDI56_11215 [Haloarcula sp. S1CR25-12]|uniref:PD-(D/E)XK endonuclease-like domain-containing protein n=1 Tax=Haloarcula saliterrae TaxID=2950534 RepID=A0ABU2FCH9_9EURY|nr:PD-(D/E)XK nuclease family protein [Haloarcula sp. S1CR25-12]MDS0259964.1 hypothetical protein [Haloarcula sp. S1CR25-12]